MTKKHLLTKRQIEVLLEVYGSKKISARSFYARRHLVLRHLRDLGLIEYDKRQDDWKTTFSGNVAIYELQ